MKVLFKITLLFFVATALSAQDLPKIVPLSPNAASIVKYGEIPVGYFTGTPNIEIPIYSIQSGELSLPLSLSYHAGGNKVESVASWVGLGWSLNSIPSISRSVRGIPDEDGGYFSLYGGKTVQELWNLSINNTTLQSYRQALFSGTADSEPDIFSYSLPGESGKFFYNQEEDTFITFPKTNLKIIRNNSFFTLITQDGTKFFFNVEETIPGGPSSFITTTWYASTMTSASGKDVIQFTYLTESPIQKTKNVVTKYHYLGGLSNGNPSDNGSILTTNTTNAKVIDKITFKNGYVKFNKNTGSYRTDLNGGYSLNNVSVYAIYDNNSEQLISKHKFTYSYKQGTGISSVGTACYAADTQSRNWMFLDKMEQVSNTDPNTSLSHEFEYNDSYLPACRYSAAQDYWGYYNGSDSNSDLIPSYYLPNSSNLIAGANRSVNPTKSDFGIIKKITYPTGGYTEFDFENNVAFTRDLQPQYSSGSQIIAGDEYFDAEETLPAINSFQKTFTINNPKDPLLNNNNPNGGATVSFQIHNPGCDLSGGANPCAYFTVTSASSPTYYIQIEGSSFYLPNGTYTMTASFNQPSPNTNYRDFIFMADWKEIVNYQDANRYAGGLRIKEIRNYASPVSQPLVKRYKYTKEYNSTESSGDVFSIPNFSYSEVVTYHNATPPQGGFDRSTLLRVRSVSNIQQVTHSGAYVGYSTVFEESDNANETGYKEYHYSNKRDYPQNYGFPYSPDMSYQLERGQLLTQRDYKKISTGFSKVLERKLSYTKEPFHSSSEYPDYSFAIKWGNLIISDIDAASYTAQTMVDYAVFGGWSALSTDSTTSYFDSGEILSITDYYYDNSKHLLPTRTKTIDSNGRHFFNATTFPQDVVSPNAVVTKLINQNRLAQTIEAKSFIDLDADGVLDPGEGLNTEKHDFREWHTNVVMPEFLKNAKGSNALEDRIVFHAYYPDGKLKEVSKAGGTRIAYVWGYNGEYPIAMIENATFATGQTNTISGAQQTLINNAVAATVNETSLSTENTLRTKLQLLRNGFPKAMVTTYTYDPLVGVTSVTTPNGLTTYYKYDGFNRLEYVRDKDGNILKKNEYAYKVNANATNN